MFVWCILGCAPNALSKFIGAHGADNSTGFWLLGGETLLQMKNSKGGTRTQVIEDCQAIVASTLHHWATYTNLFKDFGVLFWIVTRLAR